VNIKGKNGLYIFCPRNKFPQVPEYVEEEIFVSIQPNR
jgi:hypothetical protein